MTDSYERRAITRGELSVREPGSIGLDTTCDSFMLLAMTP